MTRAQEKIVQGKLDHGGSAAGRLPAYSVSSQVGFLLRRAQQRHVNIFSTHMREDLTPMQFSVLAKLHETGPCSQNSLGRRTAMDVATIKGVVARLDERGLIHKLPSSEDRRKLLIDLTPAGRLTLEKVIPRAIEISAMTLAPLTGEEQAVFMGLLRKLI
jgi:MarR family transcriptional regulator, lower aerobic nicotinate degradation pathway regulator